MCFACFACGCQVNTVLGGIVYDREPRFLPDNTPKVNTCFFQESARDELHASKRFLEVSCFQLLCFHCVDCFYVASVPRPKAHGRNGQLGRLVPVEASLG